VQGLGARALILCSLFYLIPFIAAAAAAADICGYNFAWILGRLRPRIPEPAL
jgi:hypothetical protein